jgi:hypothetical protein
MILTLAVALGAASGNEPPQFAFPAACQLGATCWVVNYVDVDAAVGSAKDFRCGAQTYDGHDGTDFAVRDAKAMEEGVDVLAAAGGTVLRVRDGVRDYEPGPDEIKKILADNKGCGNGVIIDHGSGWQSLYCHMKQGSIAVKPGQAVRNGDAIGKIGQSGAVEFPHLHFTVSRGGKKVDPFTGTEIGTTPCGVGDAVPLWQDALGIAYSPFALYAAGFAPGAADFGAIKRDAGSPERMRHTDLSALSFWMVYFGAAHDDRILMEVTGPDGKVLMQKEFAQEKDRARQFYYVGKRADGGTLQPGVYTGKAVLVRGSGQGAVRGEIIRTVVLE